MQRNDRSAPQESSSVAMTDEAAAISSIEDDGNWRNSLKENCMYAAENDKQEEGSSRRAAMSIIQDEEASECESSGHSCNSNAAVDGRYEDNDEDEDEDGDGEMLAAESSADEPTDSMGESSLPCPATSCHEASTTLPEPQAAEQAPQNQIAADESAESAAEEESTRSLEEDEMTATTVKRHNGTRTSDIKRTRRPMDMFLPRGTKSYQISIRFSGGMTFTQCDDYQREADIQFFHTKPKLENNKPAIPIQSKNTALLLLTRLRNRTTKTTKLLRGIRRKTNGGVAVDNNDKTITTSNAKKPQLPPRRFRSLSMDDLEDPLPNNSSFREKQLRRRNSGSTLITLESDGSSRTLEMFSSSFKSNNLDAAATIGSNNSDDPTAAVLFLRTVVFHPIVMVHPVAKASNYPPHLRESLWTSKQEAADARRRNEKEFAYDSNDWTKATEECDMCEDPFTGSLIHPVHVMAMKPKITKGKNRRESKKSWSSSLLRQKSS